MSELEAEFEKLPNEKPQPARFLRSEQEKRAKQAAETGGDEVDGGKFRG